MKKIRDEKASGNNLNIVEEDIYAAMKRIPGYLDITPNDFKEVYTLAFNHATERILESVSAADMMTPTVFSVKKNTPLKAVATLMASKKISGVPVVSDENMIEGVISEKDFNVFLGLEKSSTLMELTLKYLNGECINIDISDRVASDIMSSPVITVQMNTRLGDITRLFIERGINRVFVVDIETKLMGIVTRHDIIQTPLLGEWNQNVD